MIRHEICIAVRNSSLEWVTIRIPEFSIREIGALIDHLQLAAVDLEDKDRELEEEQEQDDVIKMMNAQNERMGFVTFDVWDSNRKNPFFQYAMETFGIAGICGDDTSEMTIRLMVTMNTD